VEQRPASPSPTPRSNLARETMIYGLGVVLTRAVSFMMLPVYTRYLTPTDYGVLQLVQMVLDVTAILLSAGLTSGVLRFYLKAESEDERRAVVSSAFFMLCGLNALGGLGLAASATRIADLFLSGAGPEGSLLLRIVSVTFFLEAFVAVPLLLLQVRRLAGWYMAASLTRLLLQLTLNIILVVVLGWGVKGVLIGTLCANLVVGGTLTFWMLRQTGLRMRRSAIRDLRRFGVPYQIATAGSFILTFGDRFFLQHYHGLAAVGLYGLAYQFGFLLHSLGPVPFFRAWSPHRLALASEPREIRDRSYNESFLHLNLILISLAAGIAIFIRPTLTILSAPEFWPAAAFVPLIVAAFVLQVWTDAVNLGIEVSEQTRFASLSVWISVVVILVLYTLLVPPFAGMGAALATMLSMAVRFGCTLRFSQQLWPVSWHWAPQLRLAAYGAAVVVASVVLTPTGILPQLGLGVLLFAVYAACVWTDTLGPDLRARVRGWVSSPRRTLAAFTSRG
jgi:O-antigen/teichoic acid export membrane protein